MVLAPVDDPEEPPDREALASLLADRLGIAVRAEEIGIDRHEGRWSAVLPEHIVWIAMSDAAWEKLRRDAALLDRARAAVGAVVPAVVLMDDRARVQVQQRMRGIHGHDIEARIFGRPAAEPFDGGLAPVERFAESCPLTEWGETFARELGTVFARLHAGMPAALAPELGVGRLVVDFDRIEHVIEQHVEVEARRRSLQRALPRVRAWFESMQTGDVILQGDPHHYNMFADDLGRLTGLIDFGDAIVGDRHLDLRCLHWWGPRFARLALDAYARASGHAVHEAIAGRFCVWNAFAHFEFVQPTAERCGEQAEWAAAAMTALAPEWAA